MLKGNKIIAIDGFSGAGKGTLAQRLSKHYDVIWLDTGKLYRMVAYRASVEGDCNVERLVDIALSIDLSDVEKYKNMLSSDRVGEAASKISSIPDVRAALLDIQRNIAYNGAGAILDGRDIATVVCPDAKYKIFMYADLSVRANRRLNELISYDIVGYTLDDLLVAMQGRDQRDESRQFAPLVPAEGAFMIDTSYMDAERVYMQVVSYIDSLL